MNTYKQMERKLDNTARQLGQNLLAVNLEIKKKIYELTKNCDDIPFEVIYNLPLNVPVKLPSAVCSSCIYESTEGCDCSIMTKLLARSENTCVAEVTYEAGVSLAKHYHSDIEEIIEVIDANDVVIVFETNGTINTHVLQSGDKVVVPVGRTHQVTSLAGSTLKVTFMKVR